MLLLCLMQYFIVKIMCNCHSTAPRLSHSFTEEKSTKEWKKWKCMEMEEAVNMSEYAHFCLCSFQHLLLEITNVLADKFYVRLSSLKLLVLCCYFISSCWVRQEKKIPHMHGSLFCLHWNAWQHMYMYWETLWIACLEQRSSSLAEHLSVWLLAHRQAIL